jgi:FkbM family methyltransferase
MYEILELEQFKTRHYEVEYATANWHGWTSLARMAETNYANIQTAFVDSPVHEDEFLLFGFFDGEPGLFVDVGANMGASAISTRNVNKSVEIRSFELVPLLKSVLERVAQDVPNFSFEMVGLADQSSKTSVYVPVFQNLLCTPWAALDPAIFDLDERLAGWRQITGLDSFELLRLDAEIRTLDSFNLDPKFLKIDVEGGELGVLKGARETLARSKPIVLCERSDKSDVVDWMRTQGYGGYTYFSTQNRLEPLGGPLISINYFFVHDDRVAEVAAHGVVFG